MEWPEKYLPSPCSIYGPQTKELLAKDTLLNLPVGIRQLRLEAHFESEATLSSSNWLPSALHSKEVWVCMFENLLKGWPGAFYAIWTLEMGWDERAVWAPGGETFFKWGHKFGWVHLPAKASSPRIFSFPFTVPHPRASVIQLLRSDFISLLRITIQKPGSWNYCLTQRHYPVSGVLTEPLSRSRHWTEQRSCPPEATVPLLGNVRE